MDSKGVFFLLHLFMRQTSDSELASWADSHFDRSLNWKVKIDLTQPYFWLGKLSVLLR